MRTAIRLAERGLLPDGLIRLGIRKLLRHRLRQIDPGDCIVGVQNFEPG